MKGLLIKDFCLIKNQKTFFLIIIMLAFVTLFTGMDPTFIVTYSTFVLSMFVISTISYDEYDNGYPFLFSLPVTRKDYVLSKYAFGIIVSAGTWLLTVLIATVYQYAIGKNFDLVTWLLTCSTFLVGVLYLNAIIIPLQFKFGGEKGKIALFGVFIVLSIIGFGFFKISDMMGVDWIEVINNLSEANLYTMMGIVGATPLIILPISYFISVKVIEKKEF